MNTAAMENALRQIGLSPYEVKSYLSLLQRDTLTVPEVSKLAGIPRPSAYDALEKLMTRGMCSPKPGNTKKYSSTDPALFKDKFLMEVDKATELELQKLHNSVKEREKEILEKNRAMKEEIGTVTEELRPHYEDSRQETSPLDYIEITKDPYQIHKRFMQLVAEAKEEILVFTKPPFSRSPEQRDEHLDQETEVLKRGIRGRCIYEIPTDEDESRWLSEHIKGAVRAGEEARVLKDVPMKMAIFDSRIVLFALADPVSKEPSLTSQIVEHRDLARSLKILFESLWEEAQDYHVLNA